jgi:hypothetical protein
MWETKLYTHTKLHVKLQFVWFNIYDYTLFSVFNMLLICSSWSSVPVALLFYFIMSEMQKQMVAVKVTYFVNR